jgi:alpha-galactosidase
VVAQDGSHAVFALVTVGTPAAALPPPIRFPGLDPDRVYTVRPIGTAPRYMQDAPPPWLAAGSATLSGRFLTEAGLPAPLLIPEQALLLELS